MNIIITLYQQRDNELLLKFIYLLNEKEFFNYLKIVSKKIRILVVNIKISLSICDD